MWYKLLRPRSIGSYEQLKMKFLRYYSYQYREEKDTETLIHCEQRPNVELRAYLDRFKKEAGMVINLDKSYGIRNSGAGPHKRLETPLLPLRFFYKVLK